MGYFLQKFGIKLFTEAEADDQDMSNPDEQTTDYNAEDEAQTAPDDNANADDTQNTEADQNQNDDMSADPETTDYSEEDAAIGDDGDPSDGEEGGGDPAADSGEEEQPVDEIKQKEEELYANLTDDQLDIRHKELKTQFLNMYDITTAIIDKIGDANTNEDNIGVVEYISDTLSKLRTMIVDYINNVYAGKSYIENSIIYNRFLAVLNGVNKMLEEVEKKEDK